MHNDRLTYAEHVHVTYINLCITYMLRTSSLSLTYEYMMKGYIVPHLILVFTVCQSTQIRPDLDPNLLTLWWFPICAPVICMSGPPLGRGIAGLLTFQFLKPC